MIHRRKVRVHRGRTHPDTQLADLIRRGATMEEVARLKEPRARSPQEALHALKAGNARFFSGTARRPELSAMERRAQIMTQTPFAVVLGCSDSRVPVEIVYDQGLGDIFAIRIAGNVADIGAQGSVEFAIEHLKSQLVVVMGHEGCGAVKAAMMSAEKRMSEPRNVQFLLERIVPAVTNLGRIRDEQARMREAVVANVRQQVHALKQNSVITAAVERGQIALVGAYYEISSGAVDFFETEDELCIDG